MVFLDIKLLWVNDTQFCRQQKKIYKKGSKNNGNLANCNKKQKRNGKKKSKT